MEEPVWLLDLFKSPDHQAMIDKALNDLVLNSPNMKAIWNNIQKNDYTVQLKDGDLPGDTLGSTEISESGAVITVDVFKVGRKHDCLEAVIGHELFHINDARFKYGVPEFIEIVMRDAPLPWDQRELEQSATRQEDSLRAELRTLPAYNAIAPTRRVQNIRSQRW